jgi:hypothetical protein
MVAGGLNCTHDEVRIAAFRDGFQQDSLQHRRSSLGVFSKQLLLPTPAIVGGTAALIAKDSRTMPYFRNHDRNLDDVNDVFDSPIAMQSRLSGRYYALVVVKAPFHSSTLMGVHG